MTPNEADDARSNLFMSTDALAVAQTLRDKPFHMIAVVDPTDALGRDTLARLRPGESFGGTAIVLVVKRDDMIAVLGELDARAAWVLKTSPSRCDISVDVAVIAHGGVQITEAGLSPTPAEMARFQRVLALAAARQGN